MNKISFNFGTIPKYYNRYSYLEFAKSFITSKFKSIKILETYYENQNLYITGITNNNIENENEIIKYGGVKNEYELFNSSKNK